MNVSTMRTLDRWLGVPACSLLTRWRKLAGLPRRTPPARPERILFVKLAEQGSTVLAAAAFDAAVERVGRRNVFFLCFQENRFILDVMGVIPPENVFVIRTRGLFSVVLGALGCIRKMRKAKLDTAIDLEFFARSSAVMSYLSGARWRVGFHAFAGEASYRGDLMTHRLSFNPQLHTAQVFRMMVAALAAPAEQLPAFDYVPGAVGGNGRSFQPDPAEVAEVRELLRRQSQAGQVGPLVLLNPNCSDLLPLRSWPKDRYVELARRLVERYPAVNVVFTGSPVEAEETARLAAAVGSQRALCLAGQTTLRQLLVLYGLAEVLVTNDSGPAHFATLTGVDVVVLFGPETPRLFAAVSPRSHVLWSGIACSPCVNAFNDRRSACRNNICMRRITVQQVFDEVRRIYDRRVSERSGAAATGGGAPAGDGP